MALRHGTWVSQETPGVGVTSPLDARLAIAGTVAKAASGRARSGVFFEGNASLVSGTAGMSYAVARFVVAQARAAADGAVIFSNDGTVNVATPVAPAANSRIDIVYAWQRDFVTDGVDSNPVLEVANGVASPTPVAPTLPDGAVELARATVSAGATATNGAGVVIEQTCKFTAAAGGLIVFRTAADRDADITSPVGAACFVLADDSVSVLVSGSPSPVWKNINLLSDTGWVTINPSANWTVTAPFRYRRLNGVVYLRGIVSRTTGIDNIATLPAGFRPAVNAVHPLATTSADNSVRATVTTAGVVQQTPLASGAFMYFDGVNFIAEA